MVTHQTTTARHPSQQALGHLPLASRTKPFLASGSPDDHQVNAMGLSGLRCGITSAALISKDRLDGAAGGILNCLGYKPNLSPVADVGDDDVPLARLSEESRVRLPIMVALGSAERPMACLGTMHRSLANVSDQPAAGQR